MLMIKEKLCKQNKCHSLKIKNSCRYCDRGFTTKILSWCYFVLKIWPILFENRIFYHLSYKLMINFPCFKRVSGSFWIHVNMCHFVIFFLQVLIYIISYSLFISYRIIPHMFSQYCSIIHKHINTVTCINMISHDLRWYNFHPVSCVFSIPDPLQCTVLHCMFISSHCHIILDIFFNLYIEYCQKKLYNCLLILDTEF